MTESVSRWHDATRDPGRGDLGARWLLGAALALGALRLFRLGAWSLWHDEALTLHDAHVLGSGAGIPANPLGVAAVAGTVRALAALGGSAWPDETALRLLPALCGWAAIGACAWAFAPFAGRRRAALAALLLAASPWHLYWSQNARFYTLAQLLALVGAGLWLRGLWGGSAARLALGGLLVLVAPLAHLSAALVAGALLVALPLVRSAGAAPPGLATPGLRRTLTAALVVLLAAVPATWSVWSVYLDKKATVGLSGSAHFVLTAGWYVTPVLGTAALAGVVAGWRRRDPFALYAAAVVLVVALGALGAGLFARVSAQYVFAVLPWIAVLAAVPLGERPWGALEQGWAAVLVLSGLAGVGLYFTEYRGERPRWREAYRHVWSRRGPEDLVLGTASPVGEYYLNPGATDLRTPVRVARLDAYNADVPGSWARYGRRTWFVVQRERLEDWWPEDRARTLALLAGECRLDAVFPLQIGPRDLSLYVYVRE